MAVSPQAKITPPLTDTASASRGSRPTAGTMAASPSRIWSRISPENPPSDALGHLGGSSSVEMSLMPAGYQDRKRSRSR